MQKKKKQTKSKTKKPKQKLPSISKSILKFWGLFIASILLYFLLSYSTFYEQYILLPISSIYATLSSLVLNILGENTTSNGILVTSPEFNITINKGCDGVAVTMFYVICVLLFPTSWANKGRGLLWGILSLSALNLIRVISLFLVGVYINEWFDFMHLEFWQGLFIGFTILVYGIWVYRIFTQRNIDLVTTKE